MIRFCNDDDIYSNKILEFEEKKNSKRSNIIPDTNNQSAKYDVGVKKNGQQLYTTTLKIIKSFPTHTHTHTENHEK